MLDAGPRGDPAGGGRGRHPAGLRRGAAAPAGPAARRADPARRAAVEGRRGRRGARDHHRRGEQRAAAGARHAGEGRTCRESRRRARPRSRRRCWSATSQAFWDKDIDAIVSHADPGRGLGDAAVRRLVPGRREHRPADRHPVPGRGSTTCGWWRRAANGQPAFGLYMRDQDGRVPAVPAAGAHPRAARGRARGGVLRRGLFARFDLPPGWTSTAFPSTTRTSRCRSRPRPS